MPVFLNSTLAKKLTAELLVKSLQPRSSSGFCSGKADEMLPISVSVTKASSSDAVPFVSPVLLSKLQRSDANRSAASTCYHAATRAARSGKSDWKALEQKTDLRMPMALMYFTAVPFPLQNACALKRTDTQKSIPKKSPGRMRNVIDDKKFGLQRRRLKHGTHAAHVAVQGMISCCRLGSKQKIFLPRQIAEIDCKPFPFCFASFNFFAR